MARKVFVNNSPLKELLIISFFTFLLGLFLGWLTGQIIARNCSNPYDKIQQLQSHTDTLAKMVQQQQYELDVITEYIKTTSH